MQIETSQTASKEQSTRLELVQLVANNLTIDRQIVTCFMCYREYDLAERSPIIICQNQHLSCRRCIQDIKESQRHFRCPFCRKSVSFLKKHRLLMKILEQVEQSTLQMVPNYGGKLTKLGFITCARISHQFDDNVQAKHFAVSVQELQARRQYIQLNINCRSLTDCSLGFCYANRSKFYVYSFGSNAITTEVGHLQIYATHELTKLMQSGKTVTVRVIYERKARKMQMKFMVQDRFFRTYTATVIGKHYAYLEGIDLQSWK